MNWASYTTRKVILGAGAVALVAGGWVACQWLPVAGEHYGTMVAGIGALYATFCGANTLQDHILKTKPAPSKPQPKPPVEPLPEE
jgi:hypothetical protein